MCNYPANNFTGCGCIRRKADMPLELCIVAQVYSWDCTKLFPVEQPAECFGLVCLDCLAGDKKTDGGKRKSKKSHR